MAVRTSMAALITRARFMVGDPVIAGTPTTSVFTDQQIQDVLDHHRVDVIQDELAAKPTAIVGSYSYLDYQSRWGFWEDDWAIVGGTTLATVTPDVAEPLNGRWSFTVSQLPPLYISGKTFDMYGAAVELLEAWQGLLQGQGEIVSFSEDGQSFTRAQRGSKMASQAQEYRRKARRDSPRFVDGGRW